MKETDWQPPPTFSQDEWTPELVEHCLRNRRVLEELCLWGSESAEWPPSIGVGQCCYPANMNIMTTRVDFERAWASLSRRERKLLDMYYGQGLTFQQIAAKRRCSKQNIHQIVGRIQDKLEKFLGCELTNTSNTHVYIRV